MSRTGRKQIPPTPVSLTGQNLWSTGNGPIFGTLRFHVPKTMLQKQVKSTDGIDFHFIRQSHVEKKTARGR